MRRLMKELAELQANPPDGVRIAPNEENMLDVTGIIEGPGVLLPRHCESRKVLRHA